MLQLSSLVEYSHYYSYLLDWVTISFEPPTPSIKAYLPLSKGGRKGSIYRTHISVYLSTSSYPDFDVNGTPPLPVSHTRLRSN